MAYIVAAVAKNNAAANSSNNVDGILKGSTTDEILSRFKLPQPITFMRARLPRRVDQEILNKGMSLRILSFAQS